MVDSKPSLPVERLADYFSVVGLDPALTTVENASESTL